MADWIDQVAPAAAGEPEACEALVLHFQDMAVAYAYSLLRDFALAEDVAQEAFLQLLRELPRLREPRALPAFLRRIVFKYCDRATRRKRLPTVPLAEASAPAGAGTPASALEAKQARRRVDEAMVALPDTERAVLALFHIREHSQQEICAFLDVSLPSVKNALRRARALLRERMLHMVEDELRDKRPSNDAAFRDGIRYFRALEQGDAATVRRLLAARPELLERVRSDHDPSNDRVTPGMTPLQVAASFGHDAIVDFLLDQGAEIEARSQHPDPRGRVTALHFAAYGNRLSTVSLLLDRGAALAADADGEGGGALGVAGIFYDRPEAARLLIERGAPLTFFAAVGLGLAEAVREMAERSPDLLRARATGDRQTGRLRYTPLHIAANKNRAEMVSVLLELGAERDAVDGLERSPADLALTRGHVESFRALEAAGAAPTAELLASAGSVERARSLDGFVWLCGDDANLETLRAQLTEDPSLASSVAPNFWPDNFVRAGALHFAAWMGAHGVAELLVEHGADLATRDAQYDATPADWARENSQREMAAFLDELASA